jgi:serine/threonine protein kinase
VIDDYELLERIGRGGMGEVWRARHRNLGREAAIKLIRADSLGAESDDRARRTLRRFEKEARATATLRSPHTIELYDFGIADDNTFYYAMELLEGLDLQSLVERFGPVPPHRAVHLLRQVCESLAEAHHVGLVHRDVKPANVFCCRLGLKVDYVKVLDFGLVKTAPGVDDETDLTVDGAVPGSPAFMAPEAIRGHRDLDARVDVYSLGCVAYWLLCGERVFDGRTALDMVLAHIQTDPDPLSSRSTQPIPDELDALVMACLAKKPEDRPDDAVAIARALAACPLPDPWDDARAEAWWTAHRPATPWGEPRQLESPDDGAPAQPLAPTEVDGPISTMTADFEEVAPELSQEYVVEAIKQQFDASHIDVHEYDRRSRLAQLANSEADLRAALAGLVIPEVAQPPAHADSVLFFGTEGGEDERPVPADEAQLPVPAEDAWKNIVSVFSGANRKGAWRSPARIQCIDVFGGTDLDFRFAKMAPGMTTVRCINVFGGTTIVVPPDLYVEVEGFGFFGGFGSNATDTDKPTDDTPWLKVTGLAVFGGAEVKVKSREKKGLKKLLSFLQD